MHKATFLTGTLKLTLKPDGPILIKAGDTGSADPTLPDMEFVRTQGRVYLPGPSLKGVVRAQCERICRTLDRGGRDPNKDDPPLADNPVGSGFEYGGLEDMDFNSGRYIEANRTKLKPQRKNDAQFEVTDKTAFIYRRSSFVSQMFGNTSLAGRIRFADAYGKDVVLEERNGVAIDRIYGSVAVGPFNYETAVDGVFATRIDFKNLTLAQLALLGLSLRDLAEGRIAIGFGKSRGLGRVTVEFQSLSLRYPTCERGSGGGLQLLNGTVITEHKQQLAGVGALATAAAGDFGDYHFHKQDVTAEGEETQQLLGNLDYHDDDFLGVEVVAEGQEAVYNIWRACMPLWREVIKL